MLESYGFQPTPLACHVCRSRLVSTSLLDPKGVQIALDRLGAACFCPKCGHRYRAAGRIPASWIRLLGPAGRWLWWICARLEITTPETG